MEVAGGEEIWHRRGGRKDCMGLAVIETLLREDVRFPKTSQAVGLRGRSLSLLLKANGGKEGFEVGVEIFGVDAKVPFEEV